jgi:hypothetical protein
MKGRDSGPSGASRAGVAGVNGAARRNAGQHGMVTSDPSRSTRRCARAASAARRVPSGTGSAGPSSAPRFPAVTSLHTLGPAGTNCELAAHEWFAIQGRPGTVVLHSTLEEAASEAARTPGAALMAPVAYPNLHTLVYAHLDSLELADSLITQTHNMVLARRPGVDFPRCVASHPAPVGLVPAGSTIRLVASNAQAALDCAGGEVDGCITTLPAMESNRLELVRDYGPVAMAFTVHIRRNRH